MCQGFYGAIWIAYLLRRGTTFGLQLGRLKVLCYKGLQRKSLFIAWSQKSTNFDLEFADFLFALYSFWKRAILAKRKWQIGICNRSATYCMNCGKSQFFKQLQDLRQPNTHINKKKNGPRCFEYQGTLVPWALPASLDIGFPHCYLSRFRTFLLAGPHVSRNSR